MNTEIVCNFCQDTGFVTIKKEGLDFARPCTCRESKIKKQLLEKCKGFKFSTFPYNETCGHRQKERIDAIADFQKNDKKILFLYGLRGTGKTGLAYSLLYRFLCARKKTRFISAANLCTLFQYAKVDIEKLDDLNNLREMSFVVIDDLSNVKFTDNFEVEFLNFISDFRGKLLITSNRPPDMLKFSEEAKDRIVDRLEHKEHTVLISTSGWPNLRRS